jgi:carboxymethylenebutenolidase
MWVCASTNVVHDARMTTDTNDRNVTAHWVDVECDGSSMRCYFAAPHAAGDMTPTVVLAMHLTGIDAWMRSIAHRFATEGFAIVIPDLYARFHAPDGDVVDDYKQFIPFAQKLDPAMVDRDVRAAAAWLRERYPRSKTAIAGFCMGGVMALTRTIGYRDVFSAAAVWYGAIRIDPKLVEIPVVASYGADDTGISTESVEAFRAALTVPNDVVMYPGAGHAFSDDTRPAYEKNAADDSWRRSIALLHRYLG